MREARVVEIGQRLQDMEVRGVFAKIGAERNFRRLLAEIAMAADDDADLAGPFGGSGDHPGGGAPLLAIVAPDEAGAGFGGQVGEHGEGRHAARRASASIACDT